MKHQRAINEDEKVERRQEILKASAALFQNTSYERLSMGEIARASGLAKGTLYLYFSTREELFLALVEEAFNTWFADLQTQLLQKQPGETMDHILVFARLLPDSLSQQRLLLRLLPILHNVLEQNVPFPSALAFKQHLLEHLNQTGSLIEKKFPFLSQGQGASLLLNAYAGLIGLQSMSQNSTVMRQIMERPEMKPLLIDDREGLYRIVSLLLLGLKSENERIT